MITSAKVGEISFGNLQEYQFELEDLQKKATQHNPEQDIIIWNSLKQIAFELEDPRVMKLPYAKVYYPQIQELVDQIRRQLQNDMAGSGKEPRSWRLFRFESIK